MSLVLPGAYFKWGTIDSNLIKQWAREEGFDLVGIALAEPPQRGDLLREYLTRGYAGQMDYLGRNVPQRIDPRRFLSWARSIICLAINYYNEPVESQTAGKCARTARYAWGVDYHSAIKDRLQQLVQRLRSVVGDKPRMRCCVDTAPLMEKAHAARAGLGWIGKNGLLINERFGSWLVLGEIVTDLELDYDNPVADRCGSCRRCLQGCPTGALVEPYILEARRCISYLTVESNLDIPAELSDRIGGWLFGCDVCQEVCPFNQDTPVTSVPEFQPRTGWARIDPEEILMLNKKQFTRQYLGSSIQRAKWQHFLHVAGVCKKNLSKG